MVQRYETKQNHSDYYVDLSTTYSLVAMYLIDKGVASTRAEVIAKTVNQAFKSVVALDDRNSKLVFDLMPELFNMAKLYIDVYGEEGFYFEQFLIGEVSNQELSNTLYQYMKKEHLDLENKLSDDEWENFLDRYQDDFANSCSELAYELFEEFLNLKGEK